MASGRPLLDEAVHSRPALLAGCPPATEPFEEKREDAARRRGAAIVYYVTRRISKAIMAFIHFLTPGGDHGMLGINPKHESDVISQALMASLRSCKLYCGTSSSESRDDNCVCLVARKR